MSKLLVAALAALAVTVSPANAATVSGQITRAGFVPQTAQAKVGDTVTWRNLDTVAHQVVFKTTNGVQCAQPLVIQPGQTGSCTFSRAGKFDYSDPTQRGGAFRATVNVTAGPLAVALQAVPKLVTYGGRSTLSGSISTGASGERVSILAQACGQNAFSQLADVTTGTAGAFSYSAQPTVSTSYQARYKSATSAPVLVKVRPRIRLRKVAPARFSVRVTAAASFKGRLVSLQRYSPSTRRWLLVKRVGLRTVVAGIAPTQVSSVTFRAKLRRGLRLRVVMPQSQVGGCYAPGRSNTVVN